MPTPADEPTPPVPLPSLGEAAGSAPVPVLPVLNYEKPLVYRYQSNLPPPGPLATAFWRCCFYAGKLLGLVYRPRPSPRLYTPPPRR